MASVHGEAADGPAVLKARSMHCLTCSKLLWVINLWVTMVVAILSHGHP